MMVELPDKAWLGRITHPGKDACGGMKELCISPFIHCSKRLVVGELRLPDKVGEIGNLTIAFGDHSRIGVSSGRSLGEVMLCPIIVDRLPIFLWHHSMNRLERRNRYASDLGLEGLVEDIELSGGAPVIRP